MWEDPCVHGRVNGKPECGSARVRMLGLLLNLNHKEGHSVPTLMRKDVLHLLQPGGRTFCTYYDMIDLEDISQMQKDKSSHTGSLEESPRSTETESRYGARGWNWGWGISASWGRSSSLGRWNVLEMGVGMFAQQRECAECPGAGPGGW